MVKPMSDGDDESAGAGSDRLSEPTPQTTSHDGRCRLRSLRTNEVAVVAGVEASQVAAKRLADMGFTPGVRVEMLRPGRPCLVRLNGTCMGVGARYQQSILLTIVETRAERDERRSSTPPRE